MYKYYILPLRIFFTDYKKGVDELSKFNNYIILLLIHLTPLMISIFDVMEIKLHIKSRAIFFITAFPVVMVLYLMCNRLALWFIDKYNLDTEEIRDKKLYRVGFLIFIEPIAFFFLYFFYSVFRYGR